MRTHWRDAGIGYPGLNRWRLAQDKSNEHGIAKLRRLSSAATEKFEADTGFRFASGSRAERVDWTRES
jgi:hypothetical protein